VETDPGFALAHAKLADVEIFAFRQFDRSAARLERAQRAVAEAIALDSTLAEARLARATLAFWLLGDAGAIERDLQYVRGARPNDPEMLWMLGTLQRRQAHWERAIATFERARELNPRSELYCIELAGTHMMRREFDRALHYADSAIALAPQSLAPYLQRHAIYVLRGDTATAMRVIADAVSRFGSSPVLALLLPRFREVLGRTGRLLFPAVDSLRIGQLSLDSGAYYLAKAEVRALSKRPGAAAYYDSARMVWEGRVRLQPGESVAHMELAYSLAGLGRREEALAAAERAMSLNPLERDAWSGVIRLDHAMRVAAAVGADSIVLARARELLARPSTLSRPLMRVDPVFARLRTDPRFRELASGG
jgi:tetratricopeptide (TPR) repeat protein